MFKAIKQDGGLFIPNVSHIETDNNNCGRLKIQIESNVIDSSKENYCFQNVDDIWKITKDIKGDIDDELLKDTYFMERVTHENSL